VEVWIELTGSTVLSHMYFDGYKRCIDSAVGACITILYLLSVVLNVYIKDAIAQLWTYEFDPEIALVDPAGDYIYGEGFGMLGGYAQLSFTI
jgi:hypothetical protein